MKRIAQIGLMLIVLISFSSCKKTDNILFYNDSYIKEIKQVRKDFQFYMVRNNIPGASVSVIKDGKLIYSEGFGYASKDLDVPVNRFTKFRIGALTEVFTSLAYQRLIEDGVFQPDSSIQHYYPDFPNKYYTIKLFNLVNHTSGIRQPYYDEKTERGINKTLTQGLQMFIKEPLESPPDAAENISMFNYNLLGAVMEKTTGKSFNSIIQNLVIDTLHLENTTFDNLYQPIKNRSNFFEYNMVSQVTNGISCDLRFRAPSQGLLSTSEDLVKLGNALLDSEYVTEKMRKRLFTAKMLDSDYPSQISNGWFIAKDTDGLPLYIRIGSVMGGGAGLVIYPEQKLVVAAAINITSKSENIPVFEIAGYFLPQPKENTQKDTKD